MTPIDVATNTPADTIEVEGSPAGVAVTPDGATAYVTNSGLNTVTPIDVATNTPGDPIPVGSSPEAVAVTPDGATAYVTNVNSNNVTPIDVATNTPGDPIPVDSPFGVAVTPDQAPVAALGVSAAPAGSPSVFDAAASTVRYGTIAAYAWEFGDGTTATTTTPTVTHTYAAAGTFTATVTETSSGGTSTTQVFTGQTMSRNGGPQAVAAVTVTVPAPPHHPRRCGGCRLVDRMSVTRPW